MRKSSDHKKSVTTSSQEQWPFSYHFFLEFLKTKKLLKVDEIVRNLCRMRKFLGDAWCSENRRAKAAASQWENTRDGPWGTVIS